MTSPSQRTRCFLWAPFLALTAGLVSIAQAENLIRNASFEHAHRDVMWTGFNRYSRLRHPSQMRIMDLGVEKRESVEDLPDELVDRPERGEALGWRVVEQPGEAYHGKRLAACDIEDGLEFGLESPGGWFTFSAYVRGADRDVLTFRIRDIRGHKGEIRNDQKKAFTIGEKWTRCVFTVRVRRGPVICCLETLGPSQVEVDAVQFESGESVTPFQLHPWDQSPPKPVATKDAPLHPASIQRVKVNYVAEPLRGIAPVSREVLSRPGKDGEIPLHVSLPEYVPGGSVPATGGIPLPRGHLFDGRRVRLIDVNGNPAPCQTRVLSRNVLDGSVQMLVVGVDASSRDSTWTLCYGPEVEPLQAETPLRVEQTEAAFTVVTGPLKFRVRRDRFNLIDALWFDADGDGRFGEAEQMVTSHDQQGPWTHDPAGRMYWGSGGRVDDVRVEETGPLRCSIAASGLHRSAEGQDLFRYVVRIHAYAGKPYLRIEHVFSNEQQPFATVITGAGVRLSLRKNAFSKFRVNGQTVRTVVRDETAYLVDGVGLRHWKGKKTVSTAADGDGLVTVSGAGMAVSAAIREWHWMPPKEFCFHPETGLDLCVWPKHMTSGLAVPRGVARSHQLWLLFHRPGMPEEERSAWRTFFREAAVVETEPALYCDSTVFGRLSTVDPQSFPQYENFLRRKGEGTFGRFPRPGEYRWHNFITYGDCRGDGGWANMETMLGHCMWLMYVRSLDRWYYRRAHDAAVHYRDVDMCHPWGQCRVHCHNHTLVPWDCSHSWIKGVLNHYLLTGDARSLEVAHEHGRWLLGVPIDYKIHEGSRRWTRIVQNLADLYRITGHHEYLKNFEDRIGKSEEMRGDNRHVSRFDLGKVYRREDKSKPPEASFGRLGFVQYYGIAGLMEMAQATEEDRWKKTFLEEIQYIVGDGEKGSAFTSKEDFVAWGKRRGLSVRSGRDRVCYPSLGYAYELTGERRWREALLNAAFAETTRTGWERRWPTQGYADQVLTAHGVYYAQKLQYDAEYESAMRGDTKASLRTTLRDANFDSARINAWQHGGKALALKRLRRIDISKDPETKLLGDHSLSIDVPTLVAGTKRHDKAYRRLPLELSRNYVVLRDPGRYALTGHVRFRKHGRPDVVLLIHGLNSEARREISLNLRDLLPKPRYEGMLGVEGPRPELDEDGKTVVQGTPKRDVAREDLEGPKPQIDPEDTWWRFRVTFHIDEPSKVNVILLYRFGIMPPGRVWFDEFVVKKLKAQPDHPGEVTVKRCE